MAAEEIEGRPLTRQEQLRMRQYPTRATPVPEVADFFDTEQYLRNALVSVMNPEIEDITASPKFWSVVQEVFITKNKQELKLLKQILRIGQRRGRLFRFNRNNTYEELDMLDKCPPELKDAVLGFVIKNKLHINSSSPSLNKEDIVKERKQTKLKQRQERQEMAKEDRPKETARQNKIIEKYERQDMAKEDALLQAEKALEQQKIRDKVRKKIEEQKYGAEPDDWEYKRDDDEPIGRGLRMKGGRIKIHGNYYKKV